MEKLYYFNKRHSKTLTFIFIGYVLMMGAVFVLLPSTNVYIPLIGLFILSVLKITSDAMKSLRVPNQKVKINTKVEPENTDYDESIAFKSHKAKSNTHLTKDTQLEGISIVDHETHHANVDTNDSEIFRLETDVAKQIIDKIDNQAYQRDDYYLKVYEIQSMIEDIVNKRKEY